MHRLLVNSQNKALVINPPYDAEIEYLESTGTQYINTGIMPNADYTFDTKVAATTNGNIVYWGVRQSGTYSSDNNQCYLNSNNQSGSTTSQKRINLYSTAISNNNNWDSGITPILNTMYEFINITVVSTMATHTIPITLFAFNNIGTINSSVGVCRIGTWKAYDNGICVADFIPVRVGQVGYMYDKVSGKLFGNAGTGSFTLGSDIVKDKRKALIVDDNKIIGWQEYPFESWGVGNLNNSGGYGNYKNLYYKQFPLLSDSIKIENNSSYSANIYWWTSAMSLIRINGISASGEYSAPSDAAYFSVVLYDKPTFPVVDDGYFKMYYWGLKFIKPEQKTTMTGSDYLWSCGNWNSYSEFIDETPYDNMSVRIKLPLLSNNIDMDLTDCSYNIKMNLFDSSGNRITPVSFTNGVKTENYSLNSQAQYYTLTMWDKPSATYARTAPFVLKFNL